MLRLINICTLFILSTIPSGIVPYNANRQVLLIPQDVNSHPLVPFVQSRFGEADPQPLLIENRIQKQTPYYNLYETFPKQPLPVSFFPNMSPVSSLELGLPDDSQEPEEEQYDEDFPIDYNSDQLWKVGEIPLPMGIKAYPDVYVKHEVLDLPPIADLMSVEQSELTEETHDLKDVEIEESFLKDPASQTREVVFEKVTDRPEPSTTENAAIVKLKAMKKEKSVVQGKKVAADDGTVKKTAGIEAIAEKVVMDPDEVVDVQAKFDDDDEEEEEESKNTESALL